MIDPRAESAEKLVPPSPLPYVSRRALKRVKDWTAPPTCCPYCNGPVALVENSAIYRGKLYGAWPYAYLCKPCDAFVGLHPDTDLPLGTLANKPLREARKLSKRMWQEVTGDMGLNRNQSYAWLAEKMRIPKRECHFGHFSLERCAGAIKVCAQEMGVSFEAII